MGKIKKKHRILGGVIFLVYIVLLIYFMFFAESLGRGSASSYNYNLEPFKEISRFITYRERLGMGVVIANLLGNVIAFVPFGLFLPIMINNRFGYFGMTLLSFDMSLFIELLQLATKVGSFDVDDLILNTLGGLIGYFIFRCMLKYRRRKVTADEQGKI